MATFTYVAMDNQGREMNGSIEADSLDLAIAKVRNMGFFPTRVNERKGLRRGAKTKEKRKGALHIQIKIPGLAGRVRPKQITLFVRQLATLLDAGLPLLRSLTVLQKQQKPGTLKDILKRVGEDVEGGSTFSEALAKHPRSFSKLFVNMVKAGEVGGALEAVLNRLADFSEKQQKLKRKVISALIYPAFVTVAAVGIVTLIMIKVVPVFEEIFEDIAGREKGGENALPGPTKALIKISNCLKDNWWIIPVAIVGLPILYKLISTPRAGRYAVDKVKLKLPLFGTLIQKIGVARFTRTLGTLISSGVPILQALLVTKDTAGNEVIAHAVTDVHDSIREGESIAKPLELSGIFPPLVTNMIDVGEETGALDSMLMKVADTYDDEIDTAVAGLTSLLEPLLIVGMGGVVAFIVISLFIPLIKMGTMIQR